MSTWVGISIILFLGDHAGNVSQPPTHTIIMTNKAKMLHKMALWLIQTSASLEAMFYVDGSTLKSLRVRCEVNQTAKCLVSSVFSFSH